MDPVLIQALQHKYRTLHAWRTQGTPEAVSRADFAALSRAFPGALRELDRVPMSVLEERLASLAAVLSGAAEPALWMALQSAYHGLMRAVLRIRRGLRDQLEAELADSTGCLQRMGYSAAPDEPALESIDAAMLQSIRKPPQGRLNPWVLERVALLHGVSREQVEQALFG